MGQMESKYQQHYPGTVLHTSHGDGKKLAAKSKLHPCGTSLWGSRKPELNVVRTGALTWTRRQHKRAASKGSHILATLKVRIASLPVHCEERTSQGQTKLFLKLLLSGRIHDPAPATIRIPFRITVTSVSILVHLFTSVFVCLFVWRRDHAGAQVRKSDDNLQASFSPSTMGVQELNSRPSGLTAATFTCGAISLATIFIFCSTGD